MLPALSRGSLSNAFRVGVGNPFPVFLVGLDLKVKLHGGQDARVFENYFDDFMYFLSLQLFVIIILIIICLSICVN